MQRKFGTVRVGTMGLVSLTLYVLSWELALALFVGRWLLGPVGFGPHREWAALVVCIAFAVYHAVWGRTHVRDYRSMARDSREALTWRQALIVTAMMVIAGTFGTWLFVHGRA